MISLMRRDSSAKTHRNDNYEIEGCLFEEAAGESYAAAACISKRRCVQPANINKLSSAGGGESDTIVIVPYLPHVANLSLAIFIPSAVVNSQLCPQMLVDFQTYSLPFKKVGARQISK